MVKIYANQKKEVITMADRFPKDCWDKKCPYFHTRDLSIDDLVCTCDLLKISCDACDEGFCLYLCPLSKNQKKGVGSNEHRSIASRN